MPSTTDHLVWGIMRKLQGKLTYANVVATICLFLVLGTGGAIAAKKLIPGSKIKPHSITGKQVKNGSLSAAVLKSGLPGGPTGPTGAAGPTGPAGPGGAIDPVHLVQPAVSNCAANPGSFCPSLAQSPWHNYGGGYAPVGYFKDSDGVVHLQGVARVDSCQAGNTSDCGSIFYLPPGYRPTDGTHEAVVYSGGTQAAYVDISASGSVGGKSPSNLSYAALDGITFPAR